MKIKKATNKTTIKNMRDKYYGIKFRCIIIMNIIVFGVLALCLSYPNLNSNKTILFVCYLKREEKKNSNNFIIEFKVIIAMCAKLIHVFYAYVFGLLFFLLLLFKYIFYSLFCSLTVYLYLYRTAAYGFN